MNLIEKKQFENIYNEIESIIVLSQQGLIAQNLESPGHLMSDDG